MYKCHFIDILFISLLNIPWRVFKYIFYFDQLISNKISMECNLVQWLQLQIVLGKPIGNIPQFTQ
jgi:hypothetical protein